ncbi:MAG: T9SS type A sorting domain-containing protein [Bacteroidetes bacterium]|nr:T9SS type A sorting domain-containing protein [Bacteroidota bacterium]
MKIPKTISSILFFVFLTTLYINLVAFDDGIVGFTRKNSDKIGCICHDFSPDVRVTVVINGPSTVFVNDTALYTLRISGGPAVEAGCDIATNLGTVYPSYLDTLLRRDESLPGSGFELTHKDPRAFTGPFVEFTFKYAAPSTPNVTDTIYANGNSVNHDGTSDGDRWNYADNFIISIIDRPLPVELSSFTANVNGNNAELKWTTSSEENNSGFEIERSDKSGFWVKRGFVQGHGNSVVPVNYSFTDRNLTAGKYLYRLKQIDYNGNFEYFNLSGEVLISNPSVFRLSQNYPNPFNPSTRINYDIAVTGLVRLFVYDITGKMITELVNSIQSPGSYTVGFDGSSYCSGVYFYKIETGEFSEIRTMFLVK